MLAFHSLVWETLHMTHSSNFAMTLNFIFFSVILFYIINDNFGCLTFVVTNSDLIMYIPCNHTIEHNSVWNLYNLLSACIRLLGERNRPTGGRPFDPG